MIGVCEVGIRLSAVVTLDKKPNLRLLDSHQAARKTSTSYEGTHTLNQLGHKISNFAKMKIFDFSTENRLVGQTGIASKNRPREPKIAGLQQEKIQRTMKTHALARILT